MIYDWVIFSTSVSTSPLALRKLFASSQALAYTRKEHQLLLWDKEGFRAELFCFSHFKVSNKWILLSQPWKTDKWEFNFGNSSSTLVETWDGWVRTSCSHHIWFYWLSMIRYRGFFYVQDIFCHWKNRWDLIIWSGYTRKICIPGLSFTSREDPGFHHVEAGYKWSVNQSLILIHIVQ